MKGLFVLLVLSLPLVAQAKRFSNAYVSFELPSNWNCKLEKTEWVCGSQYKNKSTQAIIILTAKERGPADTLQAYKAYLSNPKAIPAVGSGAPRKSKVLHIKERNIAGHGWVDGMQLGSEVTDFYTRYLATIKGRLAIIITFSAYKKHYTQYSTDFLRSIESLRVVASKSLLSGQPSSMTPRVNPQQLWFPVNVPNQIQKIETLPDASREGGDSSSRGAIFGVAILLATAGVYIFLKKGKS